MFYKFSGETCQNGVTVPISSSEVSSSSFHYGDDNNFARFTRIEKGYIPEEYGLGNVIKNMFVIKTNQLCFVIFNLKETT